MFFSPIQLRTQTEYLSPRGPNFHRAPWTKIDISGTKIKFKAPRNKSSMPDDIVYPASHYDLDKIHSELYGKGDFQWRSTTLVKRQWDFNGPWFTGCCGCIDMLAWILKPFNVTEELNFFCPRTFENGIANFLTSRHGERFSHITNRQALLAPMNWRPLTGFPCVAARFDAIANNYNMSHSPFSYLALPLSKHQLFIIYCGISRNMLPSRMQSKLFLDEWIDHKPFLELANQVLDSLEVTLSSEAQAQQEEALRGLQDKSLVSEFPPLYWTKSDIVQA